MQASKSLFTIQRQPITDSLLVSEFKGDLKNIAFINVQPKYDRYLRSKQLLADIQSLDEGEDLRQQKSLVLKIWRHLVENAIVYLKSLDKREEPYHDDAAYGVDKLYKFFEAFRDFEPLLYGAEEERYRDHITHVFSVFLLGEYLIRKTIKFENIVVGNPGLPVGKAISADEKRAMWCLMSLTHDLGYALAGIPSINPKARGMLEKFGIISIQELSYSFPRQPLHDFLIKFISSDLLKHPDKKGYFIPHIQSKYFLKFSEAFERRDHGIISCLVLMKNLVYFLETDYLLDPYKPFNLKDAKQFLIRRDILRSIAGHSCEDIYYLTIPRFGFLLTILDDMQEWGRPRFTELFVKVPKTGVTVEEFTDSAIHYIVELRPPDDLLTQLPEDEQKKIEQGAYKYFRRKCDWITRILRSAVGAEPRKVNVTFQVWDRLGIGSYKDYKIIHKTPEDIELSIDSRKIDWPELPEPE